MHQLSAMELRGRFLHGELSAEAIAQHFLKRIETLDSDVGAFLTVFQTRALEKARALDLKRKRGGSLGKLAGVPVALKDNIHVKGELTTCASKFLTNYVAPFDATVTYHLEAEDAILIGKTNMDEFAMGSSTENSALQRTRNPWNLECTPGGSSGGSAAAVAARFCPIAFGSDTGGSIRQPAGLCGIVGFKPTYGRVSRYGLVAFGSSLDQIGPFATNVRDAALAMEVTGRHCAHDSTSLNESAEDYMLSVRGNLGGKTLGVPWQFLEGLTPEMRQHFDKALAVYKELGVTLVDVDLSILQYSIATYYILATAEASTNLARFDGVKYGQRSKRAKTLEEVYDFSKEEGFGQEVKRRILLGTFVLSSGYQEAYYKKAQQVRTLMIQKYQEAFRHCDLIATPVTTGDAFKIGSIQDPLKMYLEDIYTIGANLAGLPALVVPGGFTEAKKPVGFMLTGPQRGDRLTFQFARAFEETAPWASAIPERFK
jgi:aspartyl-tRNA(Asn)/glutamyl-tRNA(Gln) amidotransferase subunit A